MVKGMTILNVDDLVRCMNHNVEITARKFKKQASFNRKVSLFSLLCAGYLYLLAKQSKTEREECEKKLDDYEEQIDKLSKEVRELKYKSTVINLKNHE